VESAGFLDETVALLERTPKTVAALLDGLPEGWLDTPDTAAGGWTPRDVVGHLISAELANWIPRAELVVAKGTSEPFDSFDRFAHVERDAGKSVEELVEWFGSLRNQNLARLQELVQSDADLDRRGLHPQLGEVTLRQLLSAWTVHDLDHVQQIYSSLAGSRDVAVGPFKIFLGILTRRDG